MRRNWIFLVIAVLFGPGAAGAAPHVAYIFPPGGRRGTTVSVTLSGSELDAIAGFYATGPGLAATIKPGGDAASRTVDIAIAKDAPLGIQQIRFYGKGGVSNARFFDVGQWPEQDQMQAGVPPLMVTPPMTVNGRISARSTRNGVSFTAKAGQTLVCEIQALRILGQIDDSWLKGYLEITDSAGRVLASSDGTPDDYYRWDPVIPFTPSQDGVYTAWFRDLNWRGGPTAVYRFTVSSGPEAFGIFPLGGRRGAKTKVGFFGANIKEASQTIMIPADADPILRVNCVTPAGATNLRPFQAGDLPEVMQAAGNSSRAAAQAVAFPCVVNGRIERDGVRDFYKFRLEKRQRVALEVWSRRLGTPMDSEIVLTDATGKQIADDDDGRERDSRLERELPAGEYILRVRDIDDRGGIAYPYRLFIAPPQPRFELVATPDSAVLPIGGTLALTVRTERTDGFDGDVTVTLADAPKGVSAVSLTIAKGKQEGTLTLSAAPGTAAGPFRVKLIGTGKVGDHEIRAAASTTETYNIQGTAYQRDLIGPIVLIGAK